MPTPGPSSGFTKRDLGQLEARGIGRDEAERQLVLLREPPPALELVRPCTIGDGIERLPDAALGALADAHRAAAAAGELGAFVPASGAASRMFRDLLAWHADPRTLTRAEVEADAAAGRDGAANLLEFVGGLPRLALRRDLERVLTARGASLTALAAAGPFQPLLAALLDRDGLDFAASPKGLIPFHDTPDGPHTAFEEHLEEAARLYADRTGRTRIHATVAPEHEGRFRVLLARAGARTRAQDGPDFEVAFSAQDPASDTIAVDGAGAPFRDEGGGLVFRPAGHGALLDNLAAVTTPIAMIKNIDNVAAQAHRDPTWTWTRVVVGRLCALRERAHALIRRLEDAGDAGVVVAAQDFVRAELVATDAAAATGRAAARALLDRPIRVCGMVPNTGEPGGGPFWVRGRDGRVSRQIVEGAQVRAGDPAQAAVFHAATHFNPVFLACALDDARGRRFELGRFVDPSAAIVTRRSTGGRELVALERPGLWNGGMAGWNTVFVEVPLTVFNPVKTVNDLLRPAHQA